MPRSASRSAGDSRQRAEEAGRRAALGHALRRSRFEVLPLDGVEEEVRASLATEVKVTVTASSRQGLEATLELSERLAGAGYPVVPHLSARLVRDRPHLDAILDRLLAARVRELFVLAGDAPTPAGEFLAAVELLDAMGSRRADFEAIGITGYPESHHLISDEETIRAMFAKATMATDIVSQICFDAAVIAGWIAEVRRRGTDLPIWIGLPGTVAYRRLVRISMKIGLGQSARFLRSHQGRARRLLSPQFRPDRLLAELGPTVADPASNMPGFHLYTFNEVARTERWRRETLERLAGG